MSWNPLKRSFWVKSPNKPTSPRGDLVKRVTQGVTVSPGAKPTHVRMYGAAQVSRLTQDWIISITSANAENLVSAKALRARARELERDNAWMERILSIHENNVVGHRGIRCVMKISNAQDQPDRISSQIIQSAWEKSGRVAHCTASRNMTRVEVQRLAIRALVRDGGILFRKRAGFNNDFGFALEPIEIDRLDHDYNLPIGGIQNRIQFGIEIDDFNAPIAYHIFTRHPGDVFAYSTSPRYRERVPADEIIFLWTPKRAGESISMPRVSSAMTSMNMLDKYEQSEAVAAFIASCKGGFFTKTNPDAEYKGDGDDGMGNTVTQMEPGTIEELPPYMDYKPNDPQHPTDAYPQFTKDQRRKIASAGGVPYNDMANDLEGVNFSSIRSGMLEAREGYKTLQGLLKAKLMQPWFEAWLPNAIMSGEVKLPISRLQLYFDSVHWRGRRWPWVDPLKDVQANLLSKEGKLTSLSRLIEEDEDGEDIDEVFEQIKNDEALAEEYGIDLSPPAKPVVQSGPETPAGDATPAAK